MPNEARDSRLGFFYAGKRALYISLQIWHPLMHLVAETLSGLIMIYVGGCASIQKEWQGLSFSSSGLALLLVVSCGIVAVAFGNHVRNMGFMRCMLLGALLLILHL